MAETGRPSKYDPAYCELVKQKMSEGYSKTATAGYIGVARSTFHLWCDEHPEFSDAVKIGETLRTLKLEDGLLNEGMSGPAITARIFALKNAAPEEWREKQVVEHSGPDGGDIKVSSDLDVAKAIAFLLTKGE